MKKWISVFASVSVLVLVAACGKNDLPTSDNVASNPTVDGDNSDTEDLIVGGHTVTKKSEVAATTVSLLDSEQGTLCTASLLSDEIALTAAHCVEGGNPQAMELTFGTRAASKETRQVVDAVVSPVRLQHAHDEMNNGDIALVRFSGGLPAGAAAAVMMKASHKLTDGEIVTLAGFGITSGDGNGAGTLRTVEVKIAKANYSRTEVSLDQTGNKGACHGDSGGPAFIQDNTGNLLLWGVTSRGIDDPTDHCVGQSVYTRVQPYNKWINTVVRSWKQK